MRVLHVVGARPNFMKLAPVLRAIGEQPGVEQTVVHSGQHYDYNMSDVFFQHLGVPAPDVNLQVGSGSHAQQTAAIMSAFEPVLLERKPDLTLVYGDVNSTAAVALVCAKLQSRIGHVEAGLRSFDRSMPEELNRLVTDVLADILFTPSADGDENLAREGVDPEKIHLVGNVMIDTLVRMLPSAAERWPGLRERFALSTFGLVTLHRPANVDDSAVLGPIVRALETVSASVPLLFPVHPRTAANLRSAMPALSPALQLCEPLGYLDFLALQQKAAFVITDSGGIQEETTYLGVPCLTLRENTERPVTVTVGTNTIVGRDMPRLQREVAAILAGRGKRGAIPPLWDGKAGERIAEIVVGAKRAAHAAG